MAFFMQKKFKEIGHFSRVHGYKGKIVISFNSEDPSILKKDSTIWIEEFGIPSPYKIKEIQSLNKDKRILSLLNLDNKKAEALKNKKVFVDTNDYNLNDDIFNKNSIDNYELYNQDNKLVGLINSIIEIQHNNLIQIFIKDKEVLIPYNDKNILALDHSKKLLKLNIADGLIELYVDD